MRPMDVSALFGNALDNAMESVKKLSDREKRLIHLAVYAKKDLLVIRCENYCPEVLKFQDGLPVSTKPEGAYHGYGIKSVRRAAGKYGGAVTVHNGKEWFEINVVIPLKSR